MNVTYSKNLGDAAQKEIVVSGEREALAETFLFVDEPARSGGSLGGMPKKVDLKIYLDERIFLYYSINNIYGPAKSKIPIQGSAINTF